MPPHPGQPQAYLDQRGYRSTLFESATANHSTGFTVIKPTRHKQQPYENEVSKPHDEDDAEHQDEGGRASMAFWRDVDFAFELCKRTIEESADLRGSRVGKEWLGIIERRMQWMREDEVKLSEKMEEDERLTSPVGAYELERLCRKHDDRLRRLRSGEMQDVAARPSRATKEWKGSTYDEYVQQRLRDAYDKCRDGRKAFVKEVDKAVRKERID